MATGVLIQVRDEEVLAAIDQAGRALADTQPVMDAIGSYLVMKTQRRIETETGPDGQKWPRLSPRTAAKRIGRARRGYDHMLRVSNRLYSSITEEATAEQVLVGTNVVYAAIHQFGGTVRMPAREQDIHLSTGRGRKRFVKARAKRKETRRVKVAAHKITIPARPYLGIDEEDRAEIRLIVEDHFRAEAGLP